MSREVKDRIELLIMTIVASVGMSICKERHMWCGHLACSKHHEIGSWVFDSYWIFSLCGIAVVGLKGKFNGARSTGVIATILILLMILLRTPLGHLGALILAILAMVQVVEFTLYLKRRREADQGGAGRPAIRSELDSEGMDNAQPESEMHSR
jgi:uncharacterized membrane protein